MNIDVRETIDRVFCEVLETFAFSFAESAGAEDPTPGEANMLYASMDFHGPSEGKLAVLAPEALCRTIAVNAMGIDDEAEASLETTMDTLKELLNITCGNVLTAVWGAGPVFDLSIPDVVPADIACISRLYGHPAASHFLVDDIYPVVVLIADSASAKAHTS